MTYPKCPFCSKIQKQEPIKSWKYGKMITSRTKDGTQWGSTVNCYRFGCTCSKMFNYYESIKGKSWTIPKPKPDNKN